MYFKFLSWCIFLQCLFVRSEYISIDGLIHKISVDDIISQFQAEPDKNDWVVYFNTPGGSVTDGIRLLPYFENNNVTCVVDKAYSMGFVLLQKCSKRLMLPYGSLMQHDMYLGIQDNYTSIKSYMKYLTKLYNRLAKIQYKRIGISYELFLKKIKDNWWLNAEESVKENCADSIIPTIEIVL